MKPRGYSLPLAPDGRSSLVPRPPWHYSGDFLIVEFRADPAALAALLPPVFEPAREPDRAAAVFVDWQSCSDSGEELLDPVRSQYKEFFVVVGGRYRGEDVTHVPFMWVDKDFALVRGWIQGFGKKLASVWMTRPITVGRAGPRLEPGGRFGATAAAGDRRLAEATLTIEGPATSGPTVNDPPIHQVRHFPRIDDPQAPAFWEIVRARSVDRDASAVWEGAATLSFAPGARELEPIAPIAVDRGFWLSFAYTVEANDIVERLEATP